MNTEIATKGVIVMPIGEKRITPTMQAMIDWKEEGQFRPQQYSLESNERMEYEAESIRILGGNLSNLFKGYEHEPR